jgi:4'-phosphopantetheinyl transferase EntD
MRAVRSALQAILPAEVALSVWEGGDEPELYPGEGEAIARAVEKRAREFRRGRACARAALAQLGVEPGPILVGPDRGPVWPAGFVGAITHCQGLVAAVAARASRIAAIGVDAEPARGLPGETHRHIVRPEERHPDAEVLEMAVFSAKESIHKALFPLTGVRLDFLDVVVRLDREAGRFSATPAAGARRRAPRLEELSGRFVVTDGFVLSACHLEPAG